MWGKNAQNDDDGVRVAVAATARLFVIFHRTIITREHYIDVSSGRPLSPLLYMMFSCIDDEIRTDLAKVTRRKERIARKIIVKIEAVDHSRKLGQ